MAQFLTYSTNNFGFEPFRTGANCCALNRQAMIIPEVLAENLRMLQPLFLGVPTKYYNAKNQLIFVPVWGIMKSVINIPPNLEGKFFNDELGFITQNIFVPPDPEDPNPIDGYDSNNNACNLNGQITNDLIAEWNLRVNQLKAVSLPTTPLVGSSNASLLTYTRYAKYTDQSKYDITHFSPFMKKTLPSYLVQTEEEEDRREKEKIVRTPSKETKPVKKNIKQFYVPPQASLLQQHTTAFSSLGLITQEAIQLMNYFIYPTIVVEVTTPPSQKQVRSAGVQSYILDVNTTEIPSFGDARGIKLIELGKLCAPGVAAQESDELGNVLKAFTDQCKGGFVGDLLGWAAQTLIPF